MVVKKERRSTGEGRGAEIEDTVAAVTRGRAGAGVKAGAEVERGAGRALFIPVVAGKTHRGSVDGTIRLKKECKSKECSIGFNSIICSSISSPLNSLLSNQFIWSVILENLCH